MSSPGDLLLAQSEPDRASESPSHGEESTSNEMLPSRIEENEVEETQSNISSTDDHIRDLHKPQDPNESKFKYGIIYLSYIPDGMNVRILREIMEQFGQVGRIYLEPDEEADEQKKIKKRSKSRSYLEGWVEFKKKRVAKSVAKELNGTPLQYGRKRCKINGQVWSIKYLHRFKWAHLTEQLTHDKAVVEQKRRFEISQAKKQSDFYQKMTERSKMMRRHREIEQPNKSSNFKPKQNRPTSRGEELKVSVDEELLTSIFKKVA